MCSSSVPKAPPPPVIPPPPPAPDANDQLAPLTGPQLLPPKKRAGLNSFRQDLTAPGPFGYGSGLNIPR